MLAMRQIELDGYVVDTLMRDLVGHDRRPSAFLVWLAIASQESAGRSFSYSGLADETGLSRRAVQDAVGHLIRRGLLEANRLGPTEMAVYRALKPWRRPGRR